jgi:hypothetical protein
MAKHSEPWAGGRHLTWPPVSDTDCSCHLKARSWLIWVLILCAVKAGIELDLKIKSPWWEVSYKWTCRTYSHFAATLDSTVQLLGSRRPGFKLFPSVGSINTVDLKLGYWLKHYFKKCWCQPASRVSGSLRLGYSLDICAGKVLPGEWKVQPSGDALAQPRWAAGTQQCSSTKLCQGVTHLWLKTSPEPLDISQKALVQLLLTDGSQATCIVSAVCLYLMWFSQWLCVCYEDSFPTLQRGTLNPSSPRPGHMAKKWHP